MSAGRHDDAVRAHLRDTAPPAPIGGVNWHALHQRIMADAAAHGTQGTRARSRRALPWWEFAARWAPVTVPMGMAAGLIAALALARIGIATDVPVVAIIRGDVPVAAVTDALVGPDTERWSGAAAIGE